jgi:uncharacterized membrane protein YkvA (DUF1232 family)
MFRLLQIFSNHLSCIARMLHTMWLDVRVPFSARVLLFFAPLYWICPFDFNPDFLPGGYADDLWIVPVAIALAMKLIPLAVVRDARKATAQAVCGIMCLGLTIMPSERAADQVNVHSHQNFISAVRVASSHSQNVHESVSKYRLAAQEPAAACEVNLRGTLSLAISKIAFREKGEHLPFPKMRIVGDKASLLLLARGGQFQLYGIDGDAALATRMLPVANLTQVILLPSARAGGFLLTDQFPLTRFTYGDISSVEKAAC